MTNLSLITTATPAVLPVFALSEQAKQSKELALSNSALIGRVKNKADNDAAVACMKELKGLSLQFERERKELTEPLLEAQRQLKRAVDTERDELDRELGRIECAVKEFVLEEQRRIREEQEAQQRELERIERERQAELKRIADEQARVEREARAAAEAAARAAAEATNQAQREAAAKAQAEAETKRLEAERLAKIAADEKRIADEKADLASRIEANPVEITRSNGQQNREQWVVKSINEFQLMKARPDLVRKVEFDMLAIKQILNAGEKLPGVIAEKDLRVNVRGSKSAVIEV